LQVQINNLDNRVTILENAPAPTFTLPSILVDCTLQASPLIGNGGGATPLDAVLSALINDNTYGYCALTTATGLPADIILAVESQCITSATDSLVYGTPMGTAYSGSWVNDPETAADAITNLWIALCDVFTYTSNNELTVEDTNTVNLTYASGVLSAAVQDTGWKCLEGFNTFMGTGNSYRYPQVRRIGNQLHFKGTIVVPLEKDGGGPLVYSISPGTDSYYSATSVTPYQGDGGVKLNSNGSLAFNYDTPTNTNLTVIPTTILPAGYAIDDYYVHPAGFKIATRVIDLGTASTALTTLFQITIDANGILRLVLVKDVEEGWVGESGTAWSSAHINYIVSHVAATEQVPQFDSASTTVYSDTTAGVQSVDIDFNTLEYPFTCNANDENEVGGFTIILDGLTAYISPCGTTIATPTSPCTGCATT
jgi:hypothetical protein